MGIDDLVDSEETAYWLSREEAMVVRVAVRAELARIERELATGPRGLDEVEQTLRLREQFLGSALDKLS